MSDFFMSNNDDYWKNKNEQFKAQQEKQPTQINQNTDALSRNTEAYKQKKEQHYENWNRYGVEVPDEYYDAFNKIISQVETPEQAQEEAYRIGSAIKYSQFMGIPLDEAYKNVDAYNEANFTNAQGQKGRFEALSDMLTLGNNNVKLGELGQRLMKAHRENDTELAASLMAEIDALNQQNVLMQDNAPRTWVMQALEAGAQSLPFTGAVAGAGIIGNFIAPAVGTGAAFAASSYLSGGQEYIDMIANGATPETARIVSMVSGGIQGLIEADLGITSGIVKGAARVAGKEVAENAAKKGLEEIGRKVFKRFHFGAGKKVLVNYLENYGKNVLGEGTEEFLQEITSIVGQEIAASLDGYDIPEDDFKNIVKQTTEAFRGGVLGALSMGFIPAGLNGAADVKEYKLLKDNAEVFESPEMFKDAVKESPIFEGMSDDQKADVINEVWQRAQARKEEAVNEEARKIAEVEDAAEGAEERAETEEGEEETVEQVARDESGRLMYSDDETVNEDGTVKGTFRAGDKSKAENNRYGYINYTADEKNKTVTIDTFKMTEGREGLRGELFDEFARKYAGYNIDWNTSYDIAKEEKENLIQNNPRGKKNGLNYYADENAVADASTRAKVAAEVKKNIHNVERHTDADGNVSFKRTELNNAQISSAVALLEAAAKRTGMNLTEYVEKTFGNQIFGSQEDFAKAASAQGDQVSGKAGGVSQGVAQKGWKEFGQQVKAVIYAGENADFSTWAHELAHIFQSQLDGDLKAQAEAAFNVINGDWINSKYTFKDGHTDSAAEAFAYGFQDWLKTGKAESEELKNIFQKFAEFIARAYNSLRDFINLTPEITSVYEKLLSADNDLMAQAERAVEEGDRHYRAELKRKADEAENARKAEEKQQKKAEETEREEASETTDFAEEEKELTPEEAENNLQEAENETEESNNAIDDALENTSLTDEKKTQIADVLKDETSTVVEKAEAATEAASSVYDEEIIPDDMFFQDEYNPLNKKTLITDEELDKKYFEAIKSGDMDAVQKLVDQQAVKKGYTTPEDYKDAHSAPAANIEKEDFKNLDKLRELNDESWDVNLYAIAHGIMNVDEDYFVHPNRFGYGDDISMISATAINNVIRAIKAGKDDATITVYRAVPNSIKGNQLETSGQWVSPAREYAVNHGLARFGEGEFRIIEQKVPATDLWFDFGDIKEWGYDDGTTKNVYKNVPNNRKLNEPITYDEKGEIIPLSKRFDERNPSILFQIVYHGSPHIIKRPGGDVVRGEELGFDHSKMGSGEGAQAFGWGTYVTQVEGIAKNYASKLGKMPYTAEENARLARINEIYSAPSRLNISIESKKDFLKARRTSLKDLDNGKYEARINRNIKEFTKELKAAKKEKDEDNIKFYEDLINTSIEDLNPSRKEELREAFQKDVDNTLIEIDELKKQQRTASKLLEKELPSLQKEMEEIQTAAKARPAENVYTLDIPDDDKGNYIPWNEPLNVEQFRAIYKQAKQENLEKFVGYLIEDVVLNDDTFNTPTGEWLYKQDLKWDNLSDKEKSLFLNRAGITGISYPAQYLSGGREDNAKNYVIFNENDIKVTDWHAKNSEGNLLFQQVFHGSGADFDKFDTENYGLSGEGSMSFGYGTYLTDNEDIAREYARRQGKTVITLDGEVWQPEKNNFYETLIYSNLTAGKTLEDIKEWAESIKYPDRKNPLLDTIKDLEDKGIKVEGYNRHLYTVEIPDDGYLEWNEHISKDDVKNIVSKFVDFMLAQPSKNETKIHEVEDVDSWYWDDITGHGLYETLEVASSNRPQLVSQFLHSIGYAGIKYPAGTIHGNGNGAYNYVIFNDDDAQIVDKLLFQTEAELQDEARSFDNWRDFMEYCETFHADDSVSPIPSDADAQWYQTFYEISNGIQTEQENNEQTVKEKYQRDGQTATAADALFSTYLKSYPQMIDNFLKAVADIDAIDLNSDEWAHAETAEDAKERDRIDKLKDAIDVTLSDYNWQTALKRIQGGHEIAEGLRKRLIGEMSDGFKVRDFRALYSEIMNDEQFAVDDEDTTISLLNKKLKKYKKYDILKPNEDIARVSPERRKRIAEALQNREIAEKIRNGTLKLDDEVDNYIKSLDKQIKELQKDYNELEKETQNDYQRLADAERRRLLKLHEELILARGRMKTKDAEINRKINKGLKITEKYQRQSQNLKADYDELFRKFTDLKNTIEISAEVQAALDRQEQVAGLKENLNNKQKEKSNIAEIKKMRIQLVKRAMRRVPFNRIDYENARTVIAIQRMLEPNLLGGVNRFIGIDSAFLRGVISGIVTDSDYKEKILNYLRKQDKSSQAFANFLKKVEDLKNIKDFDSWTAKERKYAIKHLPKENWVRDLNLLQLAKEREESIDLDIGMKEKQILRLDPKTGEAMHDKEGNPIYETTFVLDADDELKKLVKDAVGADMFSLIIDKPFAEWTTEELERLAQRIDELYTEGRDLKAAKDEARKREANAIRKRVEDAIKETGITINDGDTPEEKQRKAEQIAKILNQKSGLKGTEAGKDSGIKAKFDRFIHGYWDANVLRVARILDNQSEGENVRLLYRREDECFNAKTRSIMARGEAVKKVMAENNITEEGLAQAVKVPQLDTEFTVDELLYFLAADKDYAIDEKKAGKAGLSELEENDDYAATSRNAVMFGNMMSDNASQEQKEIWAQMDRDMQEAIENDTLTAEQKQDLATGQLDKKPGTTQFMNTCKIRWEIALGAANNFLSQHPEYKALMEAIEADYAAQYERMNEVSINEFNTPVHRVKAYVPLVRRESNGADNVAQVKEDLLAAYGGEAGKQWVNKGMTQRRVNIGPLNQKPVQTGLFRTWGDSIERTEHFIAYAPYVRQLNAVYKSRDAAYTRRFIEARYGRPMLEYIDNYINEVANPNAGKVREKGSELLHILRGKTAPAYLGWKLSGIVKQGLTSPWPYMQFVNPAEYLSAATKCWTSGGKMYDAIKSKSAFMASRVMDPINELVDEMNDNAKNKADRAWGKFTKLGMQGLEWIDWTCVAPGWLACYEKEYNRLQNMSEARYQEKVAELTEKNMTADIGTSEWKSREQIEAIAKQELMDDIETAAVTYADDCTRACQPSSRLTDLAPLFKNSSEAMKAFLQFQTSLNVIWQNLRYDIPYNLKQKQFWNIVGTVSGYVMAGIFMNSVMDGVRGEDDDDDMQALRNLIFYSTTQFTDAIPMIGSDITNTMDQVITGKRGFAQSGTDMTPSATKIMSALQKATKGDFKKSAALMTEGIGLFLGAPVSGVKEINKLLGKPLSEGEVNIKKGVGDVYGLAGDIIGE